MNWVPSAGWSDLEYYLTTQQNAWNPASYFAWFPTKKQGITKWNSWERGLDKPTIQGISKRLVAIQIAEQEKARMDGMKNV